MNRIYKCEFPSCSYSTTSRNKVDFHHIIPRELGGTNDNYNLICLCPTHHRNVFVENSNNGMHSIEEKNSIRILGKHFSTNGGVLHYIENNIEKYSPLTLN